nr:hypothetical protein GCM10020092_060930 [Actinoplanes digitatis]
MARVSRNRTLRPGNLNIANAYPPSTDTVRVNSTVSVDTSVELNRYWPMPSLVVGEGLVVAKAPPVGLRGA